MILCLLFFLFIVDIILQGMFVATAVKFFHRHQHTNNCSLEVIIGQLTDRPGH